MSQSLWCRHKECEGREPYISEAGHRPGVCPACKRAAHWATVPHTPPPLAKHAKPSRTKDQIAEEDRLFLKSLRIRQE